MRSENKIEEYVWKGSKQKFGGEVYQETVRLIDSTEEELNSFYTHCKAMLYNDSKQYPGRYRLLKTIADQRDKCGVELFLRSLESKDIKRYTFQESIMKFLNNNSGALREMKEYNEKNNLGPITIDFVASNCPSEYKNLPLDLVLSGCFDRLGKFNKQHITLTFILKQGVWFTPQESKDLTEKDENGKTKDKLAVLKERLQLRPDTELFVTPKGLSYTSLRAMVQLLSKKYKELTTEQLSTLRYKILFSLEDQVNKHIVQWEDRMRQIEEVINYKGYVLNS